MSVQHRVVNRGVFSITDRTGRESGIHASLSPCCSSCTCPSKLVRELSSFLGEGCTRLFMHAHDPVLVLYWCCLYLYKYACRSTVCTPTRVDDSVVRSRRALQNVQLRFREEMSPTLYSSYVRAVFCVSCLCVHTAPYQLEVGSVSPKNTKAVLLKNIGDASLG